MQMNYCIIFKSFSEIRNFSNLFSIYLFDINVHIYTEKETRPLSAVLNKDDKGHEAAFVRE